MKILFTIALLFVGYFVLKGLFSSRARVGAGRAAGGPSKGGPSRPAASGTAAKGEMTVQCAACGTFTPMSAASSSERGGQRVYFCSDDCMNAAGA